MNGFAFLVFPREGEPVLIVPSAEEALAYNGWVQDVRTFAWGLVDSGDPFENVAQILRFAARDLDLRGRRIGYEGSFEFVAAPYVSAEPGVIAGCTLKILHEAFGDSLVVVNDMVDRTSGPTDCYISQMRLANSLGERPGIASP
jgi:Xaa-Pro aminopeptidase